MSDRLHRDQLGLLLAHAWAQRGTCARRRVGCVLFDVHGREIGSGYNGPAAGVPHCSGNPCPGAKYESGAGLEFCESLHAESNSLLFCRDVWYVDVAYVTHSPCLHCVKLLMNTSCRRIVFSEPYVHDQAAHDLWVGSRVERPLVRVVAGCLDWSTNRTWEHVRPAWRLDLEPVHA